MKFQEQESPGPDSDISGRVLGFHSLSTFAFVYIMNRLAYGEGHKNMQLQNAMDRFQLIKFVHAFTQTLIKQNASIGKFQ